MAHEDLHRLRVLYDLAKATKRDTMTGKAYTDRDFASDYLDCNFNMVTKVRSGKAVSKPTIAAIQEFVSQSLSANEIIVELIVKYTSSRF